MLSSKAISSVFVLASSVLLGAVEAQAQICEPAPDGFGCVPLFCSDIPEEQCIVTVARVDVASGAITVVACECMDFNYCHVELVDGRLFPVGWCPDGGICELTEWDTDNDGIDDHFTANCVNGEVGACCEDITDGLIPYETCENLNQEDCDWLFHPDTLCEKLQACCFDHNLCYDMNPFCCVDSGGIPQGSGSTCDDVVCGEICGGISGIPCDDPNEFCKFPEGTCDWADHYGMCTPVPEGCPDVWDPVCGCDGVTYGNECEADMARMSIDHRGECDLTEGPDLIVHDLQNVMSYGAEGDISAFAVGTNACNVGNQRVSWVAHTNEHPVIGQNMYRLSEGRFEQIGMSWLIHGFYATSQSDCGPCTDITDGRELGVGCSTPHSAYLNGVQANMGPRSDVNAHTGYFPYPPAITDPSCGQCGVIDRRLQTHNADLDPALNPGALYFVEGHYVAADEAAAGNGNDNVSYRRVTISGPHDSGALYEATVTDAAQARQAGIRAWRDHDPTIVETEVQVPGDGLFILAAKAIELENGMWLYEYALQNVNSHRSCGSFSVPLPAQGAIGAVGFHDVDYHSGEPFDGTDWDTTLSSNGLTWATAGYEINPNANALRWGTLYNFRFHVNAPPQPVEVTIGLFRPGFPDSVSVRTLGPYRSPDACEPTDDGAGCVPFACSLIPEEQCIPTVLQLDVLTGAIIVVACECRNINDCHIEFGDAKPFAVGNCPPGHSCEVVAWDEDDDGMENHFAAECMPTGACCFDITGSPNSVPRCVETTQHVCESGGGFFQGVGTMCMPPEACCLTWANGYCADTDPLCCIAFGGIPQGPGSSCADVVCGRVCGGPDGIQCDNSVEFCKFPEGTCGAGDGLGICTPILSICPTLWDPVCGCDGVTYPNECVADGAGVSVAHRGECAWVCCDPKQAPTCPDGTPPRCCADGHWECDDTSGTVPCEELGIVCEPVCGGPHDIPCDSNDHFCKFPEGTCGEHDVFGMCTPFPSECPFLWDPVCGCDGMTYPNGCAADAAGVSIAHRGECEPRYCWSHDMCHVDEYCFVDDCLAETGICMPRPEECPYLWDPVCGCDGVTYFNACEAARASMSVDYPGMCEGTRCFWNDMCEPDQYCFFHVCAAETGACVARPETCPDIWDPVCGCDGVTYPNACEAARAGMSVDYPGICEGDYCWSNEMCEPDEYCFFIDCGLESGVCMPRPEVCPDIWEPVCGCDGVTYPNACEAARAGMSVDYPGECEGIHCWSNQDCAPDWYCFFHVCAAETGICMPRPEVCPDIWDPVCGCDGVTYPNACEAARAGMSVDYPGECERICGHDPSQFPPCHPDEFCKFPPGTCDDLTVTGMCTVIPDVCPEYYDPVCGCDGVTYGNECFADMAAVSIDYFGACEGPPYAAERNLKTPDLSYCPGVPKFVQIHLNPQAGATSIGLEDSPPADWVVIEISHEGTFDHVNWKVKWGPFFVGSDFPRSVSYTAVPPDEASGVVCFWGTISVDGLNEPICGDDCIDSFCCPFMEVDLPQPPCPPCPFGDCTTCPNPGCHDGRITLCELVGYACAWMHGCNDNLAGLVRAAYIWMHGECYCWDDAGGNWFPTRCPPPPSGCCPVTTTGANSGYGAEARLTNPGHAIAHVDYNRDTRKGVVRELEVPITIEAPAGTSAAALDFKIPKGWEVISISDDGEWDEFNRKVKWGPFFEDLSRTVTFKVRRLADTGRLAARGLKTRVHPDSFTGTVSFDGVNHTITVR